MDDDPTSVRLDEQIAWYDTKSQSNQRRFKWLKAGQLVAAGAIPVLATLEPADWVPGALGGVVLLLEAFQQLNQYQQNWISYRSTAEALKHEKYLFLASAGPYASVDEPRALLAERIEGLISQEHAKWVSAQQEKERSGGGRSSATT